MNNSLNYKYNFLLHYFREHNPNAASELEFHNAFELLVAVVLSAQCTDKRVNIVTKELFRQYPTPEKMAQATESALFELIKSISYPHNKAKHLSGLSKRLVSHFKGEVPQDMEALQSLPGVGRKSANVIRSVIFKQPAMAVDTHVFRVSHRLGIVKDAKTPLETEKQLVSHIPQEDIAIAHHWFILHGRYICLARNPKCNTCDLSAVCSYYINLEKKR